MPAVVMTPQVGRMYPQQMQPIRVTQNFTAVSTTILKPTRPGVWRTDNVSHGPGLIWDFGQNMAGLSTFTIVVAGLLRALGAATVATREPAPPTLPPLLGSHGSSDDNSNTTNHAHSSDIVLMLRLKHTEITNEDGSAFNNYYPGMEFNRASATCSMEDWYNHMWYECANQTDGVILSVSLDPADSQPPVVHYRQSFTYHGFRHVQLTITQLLPGGDEAPLSPAALAALPWKAFKCVAHRSHSDMPALTTLNVAGREAGKESAMIGRVFNATMASHVSNVWGIPTDCPQVRLHSIPCDEYEYMVGLC
jgi:hypothetical protein